MASSFTKTATIANGETVSDAVDLGDAFLCHIEKTTAVEGTAISFQGSSNGSTFVPVRDPVLDDGSSLTLTCTSVTAEIIPVPDPSIFAGLRWVKVVMGTAQTGEGTLTLLCQNV
jgi:hypothetical protein